MIYSKLKIFIPFVATASMIRWNMCDIKILGSIGLLFELRIGLIFYYTQLQLRSWFTKYICILNAIFITHVQKSSPFRRCHWFLVNFWFLSKKCGFPYFSWFFTVITTDFRKVSENPILRCKLWTINSFCIQKVSLYCLVSSFCG